MKRVAFGLTMVLAVAAVPACTARGQEPGVQAAGVQGVAYERITPIYDTGAGVVTPVMAGDGGRAPREGFLRRFFHRHGYCCGTDPSTVSCGTLHDEFRFIFGSCRTFFGEPCVPKRPATTRFSIASPGLPAVMFGTGGSCNCSD